MDFMMTNGEMIRHLLCTIYGNEWESKSTASTPKRFIKYLEEFNQDIEPKLKDIFGTTFDIDAGFAPMLVQKNIPFRMVCEHHLLPAMGTCHIGIVPGNETLGLSKFTRLVDAVCTERPSLQEHITTRIGDLLEEYLNPKGIMVVTNSVHGCMAVRGVNRSNIPTIVSEVRGVFKEVTSARAEFLSLIRSQ